MKPLVPSTTGVPEAYGAAASERLTGVGVERDKDQESRFGGRLICFRGEDGSAI
jgi:hypothetical protein